MPSHDDNVIDVFSHTKHLTPAHPQDELILTNFGGGLKLEFSIRADDHGRVCDVKLSDNNAPSFEPISTTPGDKGEIIQYAPRGVLVAVFINKTHKDRVSFQTLATRTSDTTDNWKTLLSHINPQL